MRVLWVISCLGPGGAQRVTAALCDGLASRGHDVTLATVHGTEADHYTAGTGVRRVALGLEGASRTAVHGLASNVQRARALRRLIRRGRPQVIVAFLPETSTVTLLATRGLGLPTVVSERVHAGELSLSRSWATARALLYRYAARLVVPSAAMQGPLHGLVAGSRIVTIPNPLAAPFLASMPDLTDLARRRTVLGAGRLAAQKDWPTLIRAFARVAPDFPDIRLRIVGEGPERTALGGLVARSGLTGRVELPGTAHDMVSEYDRAAAFVLSSRHEGFPNVIAEAMSRGLPVISTDCPTGPADLIQDGANGYLTPVGDIAALAERLGRVLASDLERHRLGHAALQVRTRLEPAHIVRRWETLLRDLVSAHPALAG